jgi:prophage DNA circulation protein
MRDWLRTLRPASYKGFPFQVESDDEDGTRRIVVHEFPLRDEPFLEDLGEGARYFNITAYLASDTADAQAAGLGGVFAAKGPGVLMLPSHGPTTVRCQEWKRSRQRDRAGYIAFTAKFVREGSAFGLASIPFLANAVFVAVGVLSGLLSASTSRQIALLGQPDHVVKDTRETFENGLARLSMLRSEVSLVEPTSSTVTRAIDTFYAQAPDLISASTGLDPALPDQIIELTLGIGAGLDPESAEQSFTRRLAEPPLTAAFTTSLGEATARLNMVAVDQMFRSAALLAYTESIVRHQYGSRRDAVTARADAAEFFDQALALAQGAQEAELYVALQTTSGALADYLSRAIIDLAPVVEISAPRVLPSLWWAWTLYQDPTRSADLVARNAPLPHPSFVPMVFEALAPSP